MHRQLLLFYTILLSLTGRTHAWRPASLGPRRSRLLRRRASFQPSALWSNRVVVEKEVVQEEVSRPVPTTMPEAIRVFFLEHAGPPLAALGIVALTAERFVGGPLQASDAVVAAFAVVLWWFQEHWIHQKLLHSEIDWIGKRIHQDHHEQPYHHVTVEPGACQ